MFLRKIPINFILIIALFLYYFFFINKGIVIYDEGYYAHIAERIANGEIPYKDFFVQFSPGYFYLLAIFYKVFGVSVLTGRVLTLILCLGIGMLTLLILDRFKVELKLKLLSLAAVAAFGFPLINNMALLAWQSVLLMLLAVLFFMDKKYIFLGLALSLLLFTKQNLGIYFFVVTNIFLLLNSKDKLKSILYTNGSFLITTLFWFSYFFLVLNGLDRFFELLRFSSRYLSVYPFSYPPLSMLFQPEGIFKLLPYYFPVIFAFFVIKELFNSKKDLPLLYFSSISLVGFFGTVFPTSDLLHVYPFLGFILVSSLLFFRKRRLFPVLRVLVLIIIGLGLYLTLFKEYYRYQPGYRYQKFKTELPRMKDIYIDEPLATDLSSINLFFLINTKKNDSVLCYPFCPMLYFILDKNNPSRFASYYPGYLTKSQEEEIIKNLTEKKVKFVVTFLEYRFNTPISEFIQRQKKVYQTGEFKIFELY